MDHQKLKTLFQGLWSFTREVRSLNSHKFMTSVQDGCASFIPWFHPDQVAAATADNDTINGSEVSDGQLQSTWLLYRESGTMQTDDHNLPKGSFTRQYLYDFANKDAIKVYLCDASIRNKDVLEPRNFTLNDELLASFKLLYHFHNIEFNKDEASDTEKVNNLKSLLCVHPCDQDMYHGTFDILDQKNYTSLWKVTGPQKSYQISTKYSKDTD